MIRIDELSGEVEHSYSKIPRQVLALPNKELPAISKLLFADIYTLGMKGGGYFKKDETLSKLLTFKGKPFTVKNIGLHLRNLEKCKLIKRETVQKSRKVRTRKIQITQKFDDYIPFPQYVFKYGHFSSASTPVVYIELFSLLNLPNNTEGYVWATNREIANNTGLSIRTVQRCIVELQEHRFIVDINIQEDGERFIYLEDEEELDYLINE